MVYTCRHLLLCCAFGSGNHSFLGGVKVFRFIAAVAALVAGVVLAPSAEAAGQVTYEVVSDGVLSTVVYFDGINDQQTLSGVSAPWSATITNRATYPLYGVTAQTSGTQVSCRITVNGQVRDTKTAVGRYSLAICSAM